jgi:hypothetical protein
MSLGMIRDLLLSSALHPDNSRISAEMYSSTAAKYTGAPAPTRSEYFPFFSMRWTLPTGNCNPALRERDTGAALADPDVVDMSLVFVVVVWLTDLFMAKCLFYFVLTERDQRNAGWNLRGNITRSAYSTPIHNNSNNRRRGILILQMADLISTLILSTVVLISFFLYIRIAGYN